MEGSWPKVNLPAVPLLHHFPTMKLRSSAIAIVCLLVGLLAGLLAEAEASKTCPQLFGTTSAALPASNSTLKAKYVATGSTASLYGKSFDANIKDFARDFRKKSFNSPFFFITHNSTRPVLNERLLLLWKRQPTTAEQKAIDATLEKIDALKRSSPQWSALANDRSARARFPVDELNAISAFNEMRSPPLGDLNTKKIADVEGWNRASNFAYSLASRKANLTRARILQLDHMINNRTQERSWPGHITPHTEINFVIQKRNGRNFIDPLETFIPGISKPEMVDYFLRWLEKNIDTVHPVLLAAQARQLLVSIHPFVDGNGRLARTIADFILMRGGYPPALIPSSTATTKDYGVVLFPLKSFEDQISVGQSYKIMTDGVLRSYQALEGVTAH